ncbi:MAG: glycosyltransferase family 39 protein [Hahellaceae bacterium]|nr:glycosyltransferase family 39 protein [Hahellaceae bacterium]MCP5168981.1 glycosyltransferase family 39 protein [Hahellaceae bacterium]
MLRRVNFIWVIGALLVIRFVSMAWVPLADTTEPRYAEIARLMLVTNDWITPWFEPGVPFWGKPPLSFWAQALSFKLFGVSEFSARLPSWLATLGTAWLLWQMAMAVSLRRVAKNAVIIYCTTSLVYVASGAVMTDAFLTLGTTWSMVAFFLASSQRVWYWRYGFFLGLAIGLLAKGPLALVLTFAPLVLWQCLHRFVLNRGSNVSVMSSYLKELPWFSGILLMLLVSLPWYIAAELKTPGFLNYFIVGEHFMRFIDAGWAGDLYGSAHKQPKGMIWMQWLWATFPWGIIALGMLIPRLFSAQGRNNVKHAFSNPLVSYLVFWTLFTPLFFTPAGNILWTYLLPSLAAFALLLALALEYIDMPMVLVNKSVRFSPWLLPVATLVFTCWVLIKPDSVKTEAGLVAFVAEDEPAPLSANETQVTSETTLYYLEEKLPFSARFYSRGNATRVTLDGLEALRESRGTINLVIPKYQFEQVSEYLHEPLQKRFENRRYILVELPAPVTEHQAPSTSGYTVKDDIHGNGDV